MALPLRCQNMVARLSVLERMVLSLVSYDWARMSRWRSPPASSKSEFVMVPCGLAGVMSFEVMSGGHAYRHRRGVLGAMPKRGVRSGVGNHTPPAPRPEASW